MKGIIKVEKLNESGLFVSEMDWDNCYKGTDNPKGNFVMIIEPLEGCDKGIIYYQKSDDGFLVEGEAYILTGRKNVLEKKISEWKYKKKAFEFIETKLD